MFTLLILLSISARAEALLSFEADVPVRFYVDGRRLSAAANIRPVEVSLDPGPHELRVDSMLGQILHAQPIEVSDGDRIEARWSFREFEITSLALPAAEDAVAAEAVEIAEVEETAAAPPEEAVLLALPVEDAPEAPSAPAEAQDGLVIAEPPIAELPIEVPAESAPIAAAATETAAPVPAVLQLAPGELHLVFTLGTDVGTRTVDITVTPDGIHVFDGAGIIYIPLNGAHSTPSTIP